MWTRRPADRFDDGQLIPAEDCPEWQALWGPEGFISDINAHGHMGYSDWRLPTVKELLSIVDFERDMPALNPGVFLLAPGANPTFRFWTSDVMYATCAGSQGTCVNFATGHVNLPADPAIAWVRACREYSPRPHPSQGSAPMPNFYGDANGDGELDLSDAVRMPMPLNERSREQGGA
jgi:hypothetical protein